MSRVLTKVNHSNIELFIFLKVKTQVNYLKKPKNISTNIALTEKLKLLCASNAKLGQPQIENQL